jgi:hypothetical protein
MKDASAITGKSGAIRVGRLGSGATGQWTFVVSANGERGGKPVDFSIHSVPYLVLNGL